MARMRHVVAVLWLLLLALPPRPDDSGALITRSTGEYLDAM